MNFLQRRPSFERGDVKTSSLGVRARLSWPNIKKVIAKIIGMMKGRHLIKVSLTFYCST